MAESKRSSSRTVVVSKAFKVVDSETRKEFRNKRIQTLEADNYNDVEPETQDEDDYEANDDTGGSSKKRKTKKASSVTNSKWSSRKPKSFERLCFEELDNVGPNYNTIAATPSAFPSNHYCSVCGYIGQYSCLRCGLRFCSIRCNTHHKETRCMKFSY